MTSTDHAKRIIQAALERAGGHKPNARRMLLRAVERDHQFLYDITRPYLEGLIIKAIADIESQAQDDRAHIAESLADLALNMAPFPEPGEMLRGTAMGEALEQPITKTNPQKPAAKPAASRVDAAPKPDRKGEPPPSAASPRHIEALRAVISAYRKDDEPRD